MNANLSPTQQRIVEAFVHRSEGFHGWHNGWFSGAYELRCRKTTVLALERFEELPFTGFRMEAGAWVSTDAARSLVAEAGE